MTTAQASSPSVIVTYIRRGADPVEPPSSDEPGADKPLAFAY